MLLQPSSTLTSKVELLYGLIIRCLGSSVFFALARFFSTLFLMDVALCCKIRHLRGLMALIPVRVSLFRSFEWLVANLCVDQGLFRSVTSYIFDQRQIANCLLKQCCFANAEQAHVSLPILILMFATSCSKGAPLRLHGLAFREVALCIWMHVCMHLCMYACMYV